MRGATTAARLCAYLCQFQSTHPLRGATPTGYSCCICLSYFNPRTPCGVRRTYIAPSLLLEISIHAPLAGCDGAFIKNHALIDKFQSTHPLRGATNRPGAAKPRIAISIHAPLAGCDTATLTWQRSYEQFQSTHPLRGATDAAGGPTAKTRRFQSTHPLRGATQVLRLTELLSLVFQSTHPLRGATTRSWNTALFMVNFNPRTPCGVRRKTYSTLKIVIHFNPRTPCGVRRL